MSQPRGLRPVKDDVAEAAQLLRQAWRTLTDAEYPDEYFEERRQLEHLPVRTRSLAQLVGSSLDVLTEADQVIRQIEGETIIRIRQEA